jgi:Ferritin-like domain
MAKISPVTRRELLAAGVSGSLAPVASASLAPVASASARSSVDAGLLSSALAVELLVVFAHQRILALRVLTGRAERVSRRLLTQDRVHVRILGAALRRLGKTPPPSPASVAEADKQLAGRSASGSLVAVRSEADALRLLYDAESIAVGAYYTALESLSDARLIRTATEIMASDAQHATALGELLHPGDVKKAVPVSVVRGKR